MLILEELEAEGIEPGVGAAAAALTLGRLMSPDAPIEPEKEMEITRTLLDFAATLFHKEMLN